MVSMQEERGWHQRKKINKENTVCCWDMQGVSHESKTLQEYYDMRAHLTRHHPHITLSKDYKANLTSAHS